MKKILIIEDCVEIQILLRSILQNSFSLEFCSSAAEALNLIKKNNYDLFLLDVVLPDEDGFHLCAHIRNTDHFKNTPILFLTSKSDISDKILGFSLGADDYIVKPFIPLELKARIEAKLKRIESIRASEQAIIKGGIKLCIDSQKAYLLQDNMNEHELALTPSEYKLLHFFVKNEGRVLSREKLLNELWANRVNVLDRTIDTHIYQLRKKLSEKSTYIESVLGEGYRFSLPAQSPVV